MEQKKQSSDKNNENRTWILQQGNHIFEPLMLNILRD
jgi:hypothetical protein